MNTYWWTKNVPIGASGIKPNIDNLDANKLKLVPVGLKNKLMW